MPGGSGFARRGEAAGLRWSNINLDSAMGEAGSCGMWAVM
jgi:hypothetical protein